MKLIHLVILQLNVFQRLDIARQYGDRAAMRRAYTNLGNAHIFLSETAKALEYYR